MQPRINKSAVEFLKSYQLAVLGFGSQGQAQALNLRDSGNIPTIGLPAKGKSRHAAKAAGFQIKTPLKCIESADIISVLIPDHKHKEFFDSIPDKKLSGKSFIFAHGLSVAFGLVKLPPSCDVILVAPHGPGVRLRELYQSGKSFTAFYGIANDASGKAGQIAKAYAAAIGCPLSKLFKTSFREEAVGDIFGEQAVLCGGLVGLIESGFETLVHHGLSPESAYLECVYQLDLIVDLIKRYGPAGMFERISKTAAFGSLQNKDKLFDHQMANKMDALYRQIESGKFARSLLEENHKGMKNLKANLAKSKRSHLQQTHDKIYRKLFRQ
jgi:ketol-acid reductoisomerase